MPEKDKGPIQGDLIEALEALTGLIAQREQRAGISAHEQTDLEGFNFGSAVDEPRPFVQERVLDPQQEWPSPAQLEALVDAILDRRLEALRAQIKYEVLQELHTRRPAR